MTQHSVVIQAKMGNEAFELLDEQIDGPERGGLGVEVGGTRVSDLVVKDDWPGAGQVAEDFQIIVGQPWAAVQDDEGGVLTALEAKDFIISLEGLVSVREGGNPRIKRSCLREADQRGGDEREHPTESGKHDKRA